MEPPVVDRPSRDRPSRTVSRKAERKLIAMVGFVIFTFLNSQRNLVQTQTQKNNDVKDLRHDETSCCGDTFLDNFDKEFDQKRSERVKAMSSGEGRRVSFDIYEPEATCFSEERFGSDVRYHAFNDGPKFICGVNFIAHQIAHHDKKCLVYSIGSNNRIEFEKAVHTFLSGCETHTFDPTLEGAFIGEEYATFHAWGLGEDGVTAEARDKSWINRSFETIFRELGHENRTIDVLKIDCEGCEYDVMPPLFELISSGRMQVDQLLIELHLDPLNKPRNVTKLKDFFLGADKAKLRVFHKERNGWGCQGRRCVEYAFASESFLRKANKDSICPKK